MLSLLNFNSEHSLTQELLISTPVKRGIGSLKKTFEIANFKLDLVMETWRMVSLV